MATTVTNIAMNDSVNTADVQSTSNAPSSPVTITTTKNNTVKRFTGINTALTINISGGSLGDELILMLVNDASLGRLITWGTGVLPDAATLLLTISKEKIIRLIHNGSSFCIVSISSSL